MMKNIKLILLFSLVTGAAFAQGCRGRNGDSKRLTSDSDCIILEQGIFRCDSLVNGYVRYMDSQHNTICVLAFENKIYKGEWDPKTKAMKQQPDPEHVPDEEGSYKNGALWSGKKYIKDQNGMVLRTLLFEEGHLTGEEK
ncbi:MAG: hypothetical protein ACJ77K_10420 [Bacteroidia bacterium]